MKRYHSTPTASPSLTQTAPSQDIPYLMRHIQAIAQERKEKLDFDTFVPEGSHSPLLQPIRKSP